MELATRMLCGYCAKEQVRCRYYMIESFRLIYSRERVSITKTCNCNLDEVVYV